MITKICDFFKRRCSLKHPRLEIYLANVLEGGAGSYVKIDSHEIPVTRILVEYEAGGMPCVTFTTAARHLDFKAMDDLRSVGVKVEVVASGVLPVNWGEP